MAFLLAQNASTFNSFHYSFFCLKFELIFSTVVAFYDFNSEGISRFNYRCIRLKLAFSTQ